MNHRKEKLKKIKILLLDVDGVLTDGSITYDSEGKNLLTFNVQDGFGIKNAMKNGLNIGVITGRKCEAVKHRIKDLGIKEFHWGVVNKMIPYERIKVKHKLADEEIAYIGDDIPDIPVLQKAGFAVITKNAVKEIKKYAHYITEVKGGNGAVREVIDMILSSKSLKQDK